MPLHVRIRIAGALVLVVAIVVVAVVIDVPNVSQLRADFGDTGLGGALLFALLYAALSLLPLPALVVTIAAGAVFGPVRGVLIVLVGANVGATAAFFLGRLLGRDAVTHLTGTRIERLDAFLGRRGFVAVLSARLVPVVPFAAFNYLGGLTALRLAPYAAGTALGILPATTAYVLVGAYAGRPGSAPFVVSVATLVLLTVIGVVAARRRRTRAAPDGAS